MNKRKRYTFTRFGERVLSVVTNDCGIQSGAHPMTMLVAGECDRAYLYWGFINPKDASPRDIFATFTNGALASHQNCILPFSVLAGLGYLHYESGEMAEIPADFPRALCYTLWVEDEF